MYEIDEHRFTLRGLEFEARIYSDHSHEPPGECEDGHGSVRFVSDSETLRRGEVVLCDLDRGRWVYDFGAALLTASRDKWGLSAAGLAKLGAKPTRGQIRAAAVRADMDHLRGWYRGDWQYVGVAVRAIAADGQPIGGKLDNAIWGVESCGDYWLEVAREIAEEIADTRAGLWRAALREAREARYWQARGVETVKGQA